MSTTIVKPTPSLCDEARLAVAGFMARYSGPTRTSYAADLHQYFTWCAQHHVEVFAARRGHIELYARAMSPNGRAQQPLALDRLELGGCHPLAAGWGGRST